MKLARLSDRAAQRRVSWALLLSLMPMLTFMGHWPAAIEIPGSNLYVSVPFAGQHGHAGHDDASASEGAHEQHCHGNSAGCSDVPAAAGVSFAMLNETILLASAGGLLWLLTAGAWRPRRSLTVQPGRRPPRTLLPDH